MLGLYKKAWASIRRICYLIEYSSHPPCDILYQMSYLQLWSLLAPLPTFFAKVYMEIFCPVLVCMDPSSTLIVFSAIAIHISLFAFYNWLVIFWFIHKLWEFLKTTKSHWPQTSFSQIKSYSIMIYKGQTTVHMLYTYSKSEKSVTPLSEAVSGTTEPFSDEDKPW